MRLDHLLSRENLDRKIKTYLTYLEDVIMIAVSGLQGVALKLVTLVVKEGTLTSA